MTNSPHPGLERQLIDQLQRMTTTCGRALSVLTELEARPESLGAGFQGWEQLQPHLQAIQQGESILAPLRQQWEQLRARPGILLRQALKQHELVLQKLITSMNALEEQARQQRDRLLPSVDTHVRHQQMQRAYQLSR